MGRGRGVLRFVGLIKLRLCGQTLGGRTGVEGKGGNQPIRVSGYWTQFCKTCITNQSNAPTQGTAALWVPL